MAKTKALISCAVTAQLIFAFVFANAKIRFSHDETQISFRIEKLKIEFSISNKSRLNFLPDP